VILHSPDAARYVLMYFGAALGGTPSQAIWAGIVLLLIAVPVFHLGLRKQLLSPGLLPAGYALLALLARLDRRLGMGVDQTFDSRYVTLAALLPIGVYFCALALARATRAGRYLVAAVRNFRRIDHQALAWAYLDPGVVFERAAWLERYRLSLFECQLSYCVSNSSRNLTPDFTTEARRHRAEEPQSPCHNHDVSPLWNFRASSRCDVGFITSHAIRHWEFWPPAD
jgi:hypothetical protein